MKKKDKYLLIIFSVISLIWTFLVYFNVFNNMDIKIYNFIISFKSEFNTYFFKIITFLCSIKFIALMCIISILLTLIKKDKSYLLIIFATLVSSVVNLIIKNFIRRDRPDKINWLITESNFSFPSGHSMMATVFYGFLTYLLHRSKLNKSVKIIILIMVLFLILLIGISRIYLGVHYTSDVIGGFLWGSTLLILIIVLTKKGKLL